MIPTLVSRRLAEGADLADAFRDTVAAFEGSVAIAASAAAAPRPAAARPAGQRPGALRRPGRRLLRRRLGALRPRRADRHATSASTARRPANPENPNASRGQIVVLDGAAAGHARRHRPAGLRRHDAAVTEADLQHARRSPPATSTAATYPHFLLKEITEAPDQLPQDAAGQARRARRRRLRGGARRRRAARATCATGLRERSHRPRPGHRPGHRPRRRPEPGRALLAAPSPTAALRVEALPATELSGFGLRADMSRHARRRHQPVGHHHRHQPHRRPRPRPRRRRCSPSSTGATVRPHRQGRRRALHVRRARRGDERRVHQGLLRADRGRASCSPGPSPTEVRRHGRPGARGRPCATCPTAMEATVGPAGRRSRPPPSSWRPPKRYWAIVGNGTNRIAAEELRIKLTELCYKVDRLRRHRGQEAHRPLVASR